MRAGLDQAGAGGGAAALVSGDDAWVLVHGEARPGCPVGPDTPFHVCSCSKPLTAAVFAWLVQQGVAGWDEPVHAVVPEFVLADPWVGRRCTFRDLAAMRVGLARDGIAEWGMDPQRPKVERLARAAHMDFETAFRDGFAYSNLCYIALSLAAERLAGRPYSALVQASLLDPLGMQDARSAGFGVPPPPQAALPHLGSAHGPLPVRELTGPNSEGSARMHWSGRDAVRWLRFLLEAMAGSDAGPVSAQGVAQMATPWALLRGSDVRSSPEGVPGAAYGLGLFFTLLGGRPLYRHGGGGRGWRHMLLLAPHARSGVMLMASAEHPAVEGLALEMLESLMGMPMRDWRTPFTRAAAQVAAAGQRAAMLRLTGQAGGPPAVDPQSGVYRHPVTGQAQINAGPDGIRIRFQDAPDFAARLVPDCDGIHRFDFDEPALARQPFDPPFFLRATEAGVDTTYFGRLERVG